MLSTLSSSVARPEPLRRRLVYHPGNGRLRKEKAVRLVDRVAIVTGAGSGSGPNQGIGKAFAKRFLEEGAKVVVAEIDEGRGKEVVSDLAELGDISFCSGR